MGLGLKNLLGGKHGFSVLVMPHDLDVFSEMPNSSPGQYQPESWVYRSH